MQVLLIKAVTVDKAEQKDTYDCPVYKTKMRPKGALGHPDGGYVFHGRVHMNSSPRSYSNVRSAR